MNEKKESMDSNLPSFGGSRGHGIDQYPISVKVWFYFKGTYFAKRPFRRINIRASFSRLSRCIIGPSELISRFALPKGKYDR